MTAVLSPPRGLTENDPFPPDCAEKYVPVRRLAVGGFGVVHLAVHRALERQVAIKVLHAEVLRDPEQVQRFNTEAKITASLAHPHIVRVLDHGAAFGIPWIAFEYVPGKSLRQLLDAAPEGLELEDALDAAIQVAGALKVAHARGVIHRDVKPDNVLEAEPGWYKVTDFGIAKWARDGAVKTRTGVVLGTPAYVAPEQILGEAATPASDVYAMGVMLFELVTGKPPYEQDNPVLLLERHLRDPVPRASDRKPGLPDALDRLLARALSKGPRDRHVSAGELAEALSRIPRPGGEPGKRTTVNSRLGVAAGPCSPTGPEARSSRTPGARARFRTLSMALVASSAAAVLALYAAGRLPRGDAPVLAVSVPASPNAGDTAVDPHPWIEKQADHLMLMADRLQVHEPTDEALFLVHNRNDAWELMNGQTERLAGLISATLPWLRAVMSAPALEGNAVCGAQEALHAILERAAPTLRHARWADSVLARKLPSLPHILAGLRRLREVLAQRALDARREALATAFAPEAEDLTGTDIWIAPLRRAALSERAAALLASQDADSTRRASPHGLAAQIFFQARAVEDLRGVCRDHDRSQEGCIALERIVRAEVELATRWPQAPAGLTTRVAERSLQRLFIACGLVAEGDWATPEERRRAVRAAERLAILGGERWHPGRTNARVDFSLSALRRNADLLGLKQDCPALFALGGAATRDRPVDRPSAAAH